MTFVLRIDSEDKFACVSRNQAYSIFASRIKFSNQSWTENNPGRRFLGCSYYGRPDACDYFKWVDPPLLHPRYKSVINGLLRNDNREDVLEKKWQRIVFYHRLVLAIVVLVVVLVHYVL
ncbi:uncharacterized protein Fot_03524 [Forsythia ovata]|uniref:Zinc finger GRF-type domain-containing protein n=1 Tax=Forsythia ovata TaxID=205694 RepID=A0ABD1XDY4_9LAMI